MNKLLNKFLDKEYPLSKDFFTKLGVYRKDEIGWNTFLANQNGQRTKATPIFLAGVGAASRINIDKFKSDLLKVLDLYGIDLNGDMESSLIDSIVDVYKNSKDEEEMQDDES